MKYQNIKKRGADIADLAENESPENDNIVQIVNRLIEFSLENHASDIHIEPAKDKLLIRFRIDGLLHSMASLPKNVHQPLISRIKILSNLKIDEYRKPQDGRIEPDDFPDISLRVSIVPTIFGEKVVLRILNDSSRDISLNSLGLSKIHKKIIEKNIEKPYGMIVASGPTGSGKTTTLYALLRSLQKEGVNIATLEDPVEYILEGVNQVQINPRIDFTFASGLRSMLRQDPDIIMVGEIRDKETAIMAANAAMTGHLVLTTMHTNDSSSVYTRLLDMGVEDFVVSGTVNLAISQRLVRKICAHCADEKPLDHSIIEKIKARKDILGVLKNTYPKPEEALKGGKFVHGAGCKKCRGTGYEGRIGVFEMINSDRSIRELILNRSSSDKIYKEAEKTGFRDLSHDAINKVLYGKTTFEEVLRATRDTQ